MAMFTDEEDDMISRTSHACVAVFEGNDLQLQTVGQSRTDVVPHPRRNAMFSDESGCEDELLVSRRRQHHVSPQLAGAVCRIG